MANTDVNGGTAPDSKKVAEHYLIDANGQVVESELEATGIRYKLLENGEVFEAQSGLPAGQHGAMFWCFGAKTKATNETSGIRNGKSKGGADEQIAAVREFFAAAMDPVNPRWGDPDREPGATGINKDALADAVAQHMDEAGKTAAFEAKGGRDAVRAKLEADKGYLRDVRSNAAIATLYSKIVGKAGKTTDDLLGSL